MTPKPEGDTAQAWPTERGSTILLAPIALLIVFMLGAITLEVASMHLRQRQLHDLATSIANDAATVGFDVEEFRSSGAITIDTGAAQSVIAPGIAISQIPEAIPSGFNVVPGAEPVVEIGLSLTHDFVLGQLIWGASTELTANGEAALVPSAP